MTRIAALSLSLAALVACFDDDPVVCTDIAMSSVTLTVVDGAGAPVAGASAEFSVDGGAFAPCEAFGDGSFACGWETEGDVTVRAEADGYGVAEATVTVEADECHVIPEAVTLTLEGPACTKEARASVMVDVSSADGGALSGLSVVWAPDPDPLESPIDCEPMSEGSFVCGWEQAGAMTITASADGYAPETVALDVPADACHVETQEVDVVLERL